MTHRTCYLIAIALLVLPSAGFAETKPTYSDSGRVKGVFVVRDEDCAARCADDSQCVEKCPLHEATTEELRKTLRRAQPH